MILSIGILLTNIRAMFYLAVFSKSIRTIMTMFNTSFLNMGPFLFILYLFVTTISLSRYVINGQKEFDEILKESYQLLFGENPDKNDSTGQWVMYIVSSNLVVIVGLNLLISIVSDNYEKVQTRIKAIDYKQRVAMLIEFEKIMFWKRDSGF